MAQKKLLFILTSGFLFISSSYGLELKYNQDTKHIKWANKLRKQAQQITNIEAKKKWNKLQEMMKNSTNKTDAFKDDYYELKEECGDDLEQDVILKIFVSSSMGNQLLKHYVNEAKKYNAVLIFNGLPEGSWRKLSNLVYDISDGENKHLALQIDDQAFNEYAISSVPTFVLVKELGIFADEDEDEEITFDKLSGNVGIRRALEIIAEEGELSKYANKILSNPYENN